MFFVLILSFFQELECLLLVRLALQVLDHDFNHQIDRKLDWLHVLHPQIGLRALLVRKTWAAWHSLLLLRNWGVLDLNCSCLWLILKFSLLVWVELVLFVELTLIIYIRTIGVFFSVFWVLIIAKIILVRRLVIKLLRIYHIWGCSYLLFANIFQNILLWALAINKFEDLKNHVLKMILKDVSEVDFGHFCHQRIVLFFI